MPLVGGSGVGAAGPQKKAGAGKHSDNNQSFQFQQYALGYARAGLFVFSCLPCGKTPAIKGGFQAATTCAATIDYWWKQKTDANIGIATGRLSGVWVLDVDGEAGAQSLRGLEARHGRLPDTWVSMTGNGRHHWFQCREPVPSSVGRVGPGLDVRADGGYVIAPPSVHPNGSRYVWFMFGDIAVAPDWLMQLVCTKPAPTISERAVAKICSSRSANGYGSAALEDEIATLANAGPGLRNTTLNRCAFRLAQLSPVVSSTVGSLPSGLLMRAT
jgi:hypothetical protein